MVNWKSLRALSARCAVGALLAAACGCSSTQMRYNVVSYNEAVADSSNQMLLLNAVRASQRYPMSFTSTGSVTASPVVEGGLESSFNFDRLVGLSTYSFSPKASLTGGYSNFNLSNINYDKFAEKSRSSISYDLVQYFIDSSWPKELLIIVFVKQYGIATASLTRIDQRRKAICSAPSTPREEQICHQLTEDIDGYTNRCDRHFHDLNRRLSESGEGRKHRYFNTARSYCGFMKFQIFARELRLVEDSSVLPNPKRHAGIIAQYRSVQGIIYFLGELIAAQNYLQEPFVPTLYIGGAGVTGGIERATVPLFVVRRNDPGAVAAAVIVRHGKEIFYIPRPDFGSPSEARSLQVLDLVTQAMTAATGQGDIPKLAPIGLYR